MHRTYDPAMGRYLEPDPAGQRTHLAPYPQAGAIARNLDRNLFLYARANPVNLFDPTGKEATSLAVGGLAGLGGSGLGGGTLASIAVGAASGALVGAVGLVSYAVAQEIAAQTGLDTAIGDALADGLDDSTDQPLDDDEAERRNKQCVQQWIDDGIYCDSLCSIRAKIACQDRANNILRRCNAGLPPLPRKPY